MSTTSLRFSFVSALSVSLLCAACSASPGSEEASTGTSDLVTSPDLVLSQIYGGGGNTGASYQSDFVEIFNRGTQPASLQGRSIQYASQTGAFQSNANVVALPNVTIAPGHYFLVRLGSSGAAGAALPAPDFSSTASQALNLSATAGKLALVDTLLNACGTAATPCTAGAWIDLVGYGSPSQAEGTGGPAGSATSALVRGGAGCNDTGNNATDFAVATPAPRNAASAPTSCGGGTDAGSNDSGTADASSVDAGGGDASGDDGGTTTDAGARDSGTKRDSGIKDEKPDASGANDSGPEPARGVPEASALPPLPGEDEPSHTSSASCASAPISPSTGAWPLGLGVALAFALRARRTRR